uniref:Uncharacterized protein n=1 Tax=Clastoptera arizonana TaxID=38151 RepID=A0A1B6C676_9HEMI
MVIFSQLNGLFTYIINLKGGAGGKGVWGKLGSELVEEDVDMNDPNYDSDSLDHGDVELKTIIPEASDDELKVSLNFSFKKECLVLIRCHVEIWTFACSSSFLYSSFIS